MKTGVMLSEMAVVLTLITSGTMGLSSGFSSVTIGVTVTTLSPSMAVKSWCNCFLQLVAPCAKLRAYVLGGLLSDRKD